MAGNIGVILAGGRSSRMGTNKAEMLFASEPLLLRVARRISPAVDSLLVVGPRSLELLAPQIRVVEDMVPGTGPLGGLYTALSTIAGSGERVFLVACDMPFVQPGLVRAMLALAEAHDEADAVVLQTDRRFQPLHAVYSLRCQPKVERALATMDHALHALLAHISTLAVGAETVRREDPNGISAFNINTPDDWQRALPLADAAMQHHQPNGDQ